MNREQELAVVRRAYAKQIMASVGLDNSDVEAAFATVERERYLGPGAWPVWRSTGYTPPPDDDPVYLYSDVLIGIVPERGLNNGMPSYHAPLIASAGIRPGEHVVHIGAGVGYYTAIMAHLSGTAGRVTAIEFDATLAGRAALNFSNAGNVQVHEGGGFSMPFEKADVIYVNAGATHPANNWLDQLNDGGRLILPHTAKKTLPPGGAGSITRRGAVFRIERNGVEYLANWVSAVGVYRCEGGRDDAAAAALDAALQKGGWQAVTRLYRTDSLSADRCWLRGRGWALAYE